MNLDIGLFENYLDNETTLSASSKANYLQAVRQFLKSSPDVHNLSDYNNFLMRVMGRAKKRGDLYHYALKRFIQFRIEDTTFRNRLINNLIQPQRRDPKTVGMRKRLSNDKREEVICNLRKLKHQIIALIQKETGLRIGDILRMRKGCINFEDDNGKRILRLNVIGKGERQTTVYIHNKDDVKAIASYIRLDEDIKPNLLQRKKVEDIYYFMDMGQNKGSKEEHKLLKANYMRYWLDLKQALTSSNIDYRRFATHDFRRCFSDDNYKMFNDIRTLKQALNHKQIETTLRYIQHSGLDNKKIFEKMQVQ